MVTISLKPKLEICLLLELISYVRREHFDQAGLLQVLTLVAAGRDSNKPSVIAATLDTHVEMSVTRDRIDFSFKLRGGTNVESELAEAIKVYKSIYEIEAIESRETSFARFKSEVSRIFGEPQLKGNSAFET